MGYLDDLERVWRAKRKSVDSLTQDRPRALRGRDFVFELTRLSVLAADKRFIAAIDALFEHKIIDRHMNFTRWRPAVLAKQDEEMNLIIINTINVMIENGRKSLRRACAELAADLGSPGASFEAARKQLEILYASRK